MQAVTPIRPNSGPQAQFLSSPADIVVFGGGRGGAKTGGLVIDAARGFGLPGYRAMLLRRTYPEVIQPNGIWQTSQKWYPGLRGRPRESAPMVWRFPSGAECTFSHLQHETDIEKHYGSGLDYIGIDQAEQFTEAQIWGLWSCLRSTIPEVKPALRLTCNPDPDCYLRVLLDWWIGADGYALPERDGVIRWMFRRDDGSLCWGDSLEEIWPAFELERADLLEREPGARPISVQFIVADTRDNPHLDDGYVARLMELPPVLRKRHLGDLRHRGGNWNARPAAGMLQFRKWCRFVDQIDPDDQIVKTVRAWDFAGTEPSDAYPDPDWSRCIKMVRTKQGRIYLVHGDGCRKTPGSVRDMLDRYAESDGSTVTVALWQDPAQAGKDQIGSIMKEITGVPVRARVESQTKHTAMAGTIAAQAEHGNVWIVRGPWVDSFLAEADAFPDGKHDDWISALCRGYLELQGGPQTSGYRGISSGRRGHQEERRASRRKGARGARRSVLL